MTAQAGYSQLTQLYPTGLEAPLQQCLPRTGLAGLGSLDLRSCRGVTDETLASLPDLAPGLQQLRIAGEQRQQAHAIDIRTQGGNDEHTRSNARYVVMDTTTGHMEETCSRIADDTEQIIVHCCSYDRLC